MLDDGFAGIEAISNRLVRARVMTMMARVYDRLDQTERACGLLESALDIRRGGLGPDHPETVETLGALARARSRAGKHDAADAAAAEVLRVRQSVCGPDAPLLADAWTLRGEGRFYARDNAAAAECFGEALAVRRRIAQRADPQLAVCLSNLGSALARLNRLGEAEPLLRESVAIRRQIGDDRESLLAIDALGQLVWNRDRRGSEQIYAEELSLARGLYRPNHPRLAWILTNYAYTVDMNQGPAAAEPHYRESVAIYRTAFGDSPTRDVAWAIDMLASNLNRQNRRDEARPLLIESLDIRIKLLGSDHARTRSAVTKLENFDRDAAALAKKPQGPADGQ